MDLLFYHRFLKVLVAFDLKAGAFEPECAGKDGFLPEVLNEKERAPDDLPSIGIIPCAENDDVEVGPIGKIRPAEGCPEGVCAQGRAHSNLR